MNFFEPILSFFFWFFLFIAVIGGFVYLFTKDLSHLGYGIAPLAAFIGLKGFVFLAQNVIEPVVVATGTIAIRGISYGIHNIREITLWSLGVLVFLGLIRFLLSRIKRKNS